MIDLSKFVGQKVVCTLRGGDKITGVLELDTIRKHPRNPYAIVGDSHLYMVDGLRYENKEDYKDIIHVEALEPINTSVKELQPETFHALAKALAPEALKAIQKDEKYVGLMTELLDKFMVQHLGEMNSYVRGELAFIIFDSIRISGAT